MAMANMTMPTTFLAKGTCQGSSSSSIDQISSPIFFVFGFVYCGQNLPLRCANIYVYMKYPHQNKGLCYVRLVGIAKFVAVSYIKVAMVYFLAPDLFKAVVNKVYTRNVNPPVP
jgi:hypothetical protein